LLNLIPIRHRACYYGSPGWIAANSAERLQTVLAGLRGSDLNSSRRSPSSVMVVAEEPACEALDRLGEALDLLMHPSFDFWSHPREYYARFRRVQVIGSDAPGSDRMAMKGLLSTALGR
jgi:hypothetical protein